MGTRGLLGFLICGKYRGSYNHFDSYPWSPGLGFAIAQFLESLSEDDMVTMARNVRALEWDKTWDESIRLAEPLRPILAGTRKCMPDASDFRYDGLFCEYAYFLDFDNRILEIWESATRVARLPFAEATTEYMQTVAFGSGDEVEDDEVNSDEDEQSEGGEGVEGGDKRGDGGEVGEKQKGGSGTQDRGADNHADEAKAADDGESGSSEDEPSVELASASGDKDEHAADRTTVQLVSSDVMDQLIMAMTASVTRG